jgi:large subunit ribosomal protein L32
MGALPKRKYAKARRGKRRSHLGATPPPLDLCPQCNSPKRSHHACPECGYYGDREVVQVKGAKKVA